MFRIIEAVIKTKEDSPTRKKYDDYVDTFLLKCSRTE
jgi:hypothetical protein